MIVEDGRLDADDVRHVIEAKRELVERDGLLEFCRRPSRWTRSPTSCGSRSGSRSAACSWRIRERAADFGLEFPRGILLVGVQGCGKSLCAKAVAAAWRLPLVRLDPGALYDKYIGETEQNFRKAMGSAERIAPLVLWIDEIEKAFAAGGAEDGGTSLRVLGTFLSWLQERRATSSWSPRPTTCSACRRSCCARAASTRSSSSTCRTKRHGSTILDIHLRKRKQDPAQFDLPGLARDSDGYSGAELEQVVVSALYTAYSAAAPLTDALLRDELKQMPPIASTAREKISFLRQWADGRTVPAN